MFRSQAEYLITWQGWLNEHEKAKAMHKAATEHENLVLWCERALRAAFAASDVPGRHVFNVREAAELLARWISQQPTR